MIKTACSAINTGASSYISNSTISVAIVIAAVLSLAGCARVNPQFNPAKPHHTAGGFKNNYSTSATKSPGDFFRLQLQRLRHGLPKAPQTPTPTTAPLLEPIHANAMKKWLDDFEISTVKELDWGDRALVNGVEFNFTPVQHWSAHKVGDRSQTLWGDWAVFGPDTHWYFSGDTGYSQDFSDTQERFADLQAPAKGGGFDIATIAVGAYEPRWFMKVQHVNPAEAVQVHKDLMAKLSAGVHWGTFALTDEPLNQPPKDLAIAVRENNLAQGEFTVIAISETRKLPSRSAQ